MKRFLIKTLFFVTPFILIVISFALTDPFRIIKSYRNYFDNFIVEPNRDFVSTEVYLRNRAKYKYNSFIFGSSRTLAYRTKSWKKHLDSTAVPFVFDASGESIFGIYTKINYIDKVGDSLKNCLIILCNNCSFIYEADHKGHLFMKHPTVAGTSWSNFYFESLKAYLDFDFLRNYRHYLFANIFNSSEHSCGNRMNVEYDTITNDYRLAGVENEIQNNFQLYYRKHKKLFYERKSFVKQSKQEISDKQKSMLIEIKKIFDKHRTKYRIVISPLYTQIKFNENDLKLLRSIFGIYVYDFSGKNEFTNNIYNYFENSHYKPVVGDSIMNMIYK